MKGFPIVVSQALHSADNNSYQLFSGWYFSYDTS